MDYALVRSLIATYLWSHLKQVAFDPLPLTVKIKHDPLPLNYGDFVLSYKGFDLGSVTNVRIVG